MNKPHGTRGEVFVWPLTDHPEQTFAPGVRLLIAAPDEDVPDVDLPPLRVVAVRPYRRGFLVTFGGVDDRAAADLLRDRYLVRPMAELEPAEGDELFYHELLGMSVETRAGEVVGRVVEVYELRPADMLEVRGPRGTVLVPFTRAVLVEVDREGGRLVVDPPPGLLDL